MKKQLLFTLGAIIMFFASFGSPIIGPSNGCVGSLYYFSDSTYPYLGKWFSSNPSVASIDSFGNLTAVAPGTTTIMFAYVGDTSITSFTVDTTALPITESATSLCAGATQACTDGMAGGTWSTSNPFVATVSASGVVTGIGAGSVYIYYTVSGSCPASKLNTVTGASPGFITAPPTLCTGSTVDLGLDTMITPGGTWSSSDAAIASIDSDGNVTAIAAGTATISYTVPSSCGTGYATAPVTVSAATVPGTISGSTSVSVGSTTTLSDYTASATGIWSSADASIASISASGTVMGIAAGTTTISYTVDGCGGTLTATASITVSSLNGISGYVNFANGTCFDNVEVWLISYNPTTMDLEAIDSMTMPTSGDSSVFYHFTGMSTDSFRIKAALTDTGCGGLTGYTPTYYTSSFYWNAADVVYHTSGSSDINKDINMIAGTPTTGPGFISGNVTTGADRNSSETIPVTGLLIFVMDASSHTLIQQTHTDATGSYSFSGLPVGTYEVYPEAINYSTTPYVSISVSAATPAVNTADFKEHTTSRTITPTNPESVSTVIAPVSAVFSFPNPTTGILHVQWQETISEKGNLVIADVTGREVYKTTLNMNQGTGTSQVDMSGLTDGLYIVTMKSGTINYNNKIQVQH